MAALSPVEAFAAALKLSPRLKGVRIEEGPAALATQGAPPRIVLFSPGGPYESPESNDNLTDEQLAVECHCWGRDGGALWQLRQALVVAAWEYRMDSGINVQHRRVELDTEADTSRDGRGAIVVFDLRAPIENTPLAADAGEGDVERVQFTADGGVGDGTTTTIPQE